MKNINRFILLTLLIVLSIGQMGFIARAESTLSDEENNYIRSLGTLKAGILDDVAPLMYQDKDRSYKGISVLVMNELATILGLDIQYTTYQDIDEVNQGDFDIFLTASPNYITYIDGDIYLSEPYFKGEQVLMYNKRYAPYELKGKRHGIVAGGKIPEGIREEVTKFKNREEVINAIEKGRVDYAYGNIYSLAFYDLQNSYKNISYIPVDAPAREYSLGVRKENIGLLPILNKGIASIDDSRMNTLVLEAISDVERKFNFRNFIEEYIYIIIILITLIFSYMIVNNKKLKTSIEIIKRNEEEIRKLSYYDSLTGLYNRRYMEEELERADKHRKFPISIIMGDVNGLKLINDNLGHQAGDKLLTNIAKALKKSCRAEDIIARYGGDEFVIILYDTSFKETGNIILRIKDISKDMCMPDMPLSISLGYASKNSGEESIYEVMKKADESMYRNKAEESVIFKDTIIKSFDELSLELNRCK